MKKKIPVIFMIVSITILVIAIIGSTYAYFAWSTSESEKTVIVTDVGAITIFYNAGSSINESIKPVGDKEQGIVKTIEIATNTSSAQMNLFLDINKLDEGLKHSSFRYEFYKGDSLVKEGNFTDEYLNSNTVDCSYNNTKHIVLLDSETITTTKVTYKLYIWIDGTVVNPNTMQNQSFSFDLHGEGVNAIIKEGEIPDITDIPSGSAAYTIASKYVNAPKTDAINNSIIYEYAPSVNMTNDIAGNIRYYGKDPDNYIYFNCDDYNNQTKDTCELWRIIGVFIDKVKIVRDTSIGTYSWDNKNISTGAENDNGKNDWTTARLMKLLNPPDYYKVDPNDNGLGQSLYYNGQSGTCYANAGNATRTCDFTKTGLKNDETRNKIAEITWNIGGHNTNAVYPNQIYEYERGTKVYSGRPTTWTGKVGLMYASDYGYAADFISCTGALNAYNSETCISTNYLYKGSNEWLLVPVSSTSYSAWIVHATGYVDYGSNAYRAHAIRPVLYLNSDEIIESDTTGTRDNPYKLKV